MTAAANEAGRTPSRLVRRLPLLAPALVALLAGLWTGLERLGLDVPALRPELAGLHGPLMVLGFLGAQIGLERAAALQRPWTYGVPAAAGAGALWLILGLPERAGQAMLAVAGFGLVAVSVLIQRIQPAWHNFVMGIGAAAWAAGATAWLLGASIVEIVPWLVAFLVLTIVGERLELSRMGGVTSAARAVLLGAIALFAIGVAASMQWPDVGIRVAGAGLLVQALWLLRFDIARRTVRQRGATRYMAIALLSGYVWLAAGAVLWIAEGGLTGYGFGYDAMLHTIFVGFVFSMIFAHAQVIVPAVLGVALPFRSSFYVSLALLQAGLVMRLAGAAAADTAIWRAGGVINEIAIVLFLALAASSAVRARRARSGARRAARAAA